MRLPHPSGAFQSSAGASLQETPEQKVRRWLEEWEQVDLDPEQKAYKIRRMARKDGFNIVGKCGLATTCWVTEYEDGEITINLGIFDSQIQGTRSFDQYVEIISAELAKKGER